MSRVLILDDDQLFCRTLRDGLLLTRELEVTDVDMTNSVDKATLRIIRAVETNSPYDIFLVDQYLGNGTDGIQVMGDLRRISPSTDAIVFTGMGDPTSGQRAYAAGAARYLQKPFEIDELISIMQSLKEWRRVLHERTWMQALIEITEETEKLQDFGQVASAIVKGALRLGFERSYLMWIPERQPMEGMEMVGMHIAGAYAIPEFVGQRFRIEDSPYALAASESRDVLFLNKYNQGRGVMEKQYGPEQFPPPIGEWACLPLWSNERFSGILVLDNADRDATLSDDQRKLLQLYARQVTAILERARLFGRELHNRQEIQLINQIGKQITVYVNDLDRLLEEIHIQISRRFNVTNFFIALINEETQKLDFRLQYESGKRRAHHTRRMHSGLTGHIVQMQTHEPLYLPTGTETYCQEHSIHAFGKPAKCWVGIPLWVVNRMIGVIAIQHYEQEGFYSHRDVELLAAVADQVAGAIYVARLVELEQARLNLMQQASAELVRLVNENETWMWRALLNIITASYGLKFNRAWLFLSEAENTRLAGVLGIGQVEIEEAHHEWERDQRANITFERFVELLRGEKLRVTPLEAATKILEFSAPEDTAKIWDDVLFRVIRTDVRVHLSAEDARRMLPEKFVSQFGASECAVVPLRAGDRCIGLVIVDNLHNGDPVEEESLDRMETFLNTAGLVYLNAQQHAQQQALLNATHAVAGQNEKVSLGETLTQVCRAARVVNHAELVTVYPIKDGGPDEFDTNNVGRDGFQRQPGKSVKDKPRQRGMAAFILRGARLISNDLAADARLIDGERLADHPFIVREGIQAFIGMPVLDQLTAAPLGVLYLNYRKTQRFSSADIQHAETFANLAAIAIRNARSAALGQASQRELNILQKVLKAALTYPVERVVIQTLLSAINELLQSEKVRCQVILANWETLRESEPPDLVLHAFSGGPDTPVVETDLLSEERDRVRKAMEGGTMVLFADHLRAFVPIRTGVRSLGVLDVFDPDAEISTKRQRTLERIAAIAALALDNARRQMNMVSALKSAKAFTEPASLSDTLKAINEQIRTVSPDISALTIWYMDHRSGMVKRGPTFGVIYQDQMLPNLTPEGSVLKTVLESPEPIWADDALKEKRLIHKFVYREGIRSVAAFPLRADDIVVGAMFFNYRREHHFTLEERSLFSLLAEIVAASILDSMRLEEKQRESARLEATLSITEAIGTSLDLSQVIDKALAKLSEIMKAQCSPCLLIYRENERLLEFSPESLKYYHVDIPEECDLRFLHLDDQAIVARVARLTLKQHHSHPENIPNVEEDPDYRRMITSTRSELCVSLVSDGKLLGVLALESPERNAFDTEETRQVMGIAQQISLAIERVQQMRRLQFKDTVATATAWATEIAHDINREVGKIRDHVYWIKEGLNDPEQVRAHLDRIVESSAKLSSVGPLGNMSYKPFHVNEDLEHWVTSFVENSEAEIAVKFELCEDLVIQANTIGLERVLRHLVRNAVQAMKDGGMLTVRTLISPHDKTLEIQIQDSGPGIDETVRQQLFQQPVTTKDGRGGFGLLLVRQIVEGMNGMIWIKPQEPGRGTTFCIRLPAEEQDEGASKENPAQAQTPGQEPPDSGPQFQQPGLEAAK